MSGLTAGEHRAVAAETRRRRNAAARERRMAPVRVLRVHDPEGGPALWVALSRSHAGAGYLLRFGPDHRPLCGCTGFAIRGTCSHIEALHALLAPGSERAAGARP